MIESADDIIAALRSIIADYEQRSAVQPDADRAAPGNPSPPDPPGAATLPQWQQDVTVASIEDRGRKMALRGRAEFVQWYAKLDDDQRKRLQAIAGEIKALFPEPAAIAKAMGES